MSRYPYLEIQTDAIRHNFARLAEELKPRGIQVMGVNKVFDGYAPTASAMLKAGIGIVGESKAANLRKLENLPMRKALIRSPGLSEARETARYADIVAVCDRKTLAALSREAVSLKRVLMILLMVDMGDIREGYWFQDERGIGEALEDILKLPGLGLYGLGTNFGCYGTVMATRDNAIAFVELAEGLERRYNITFPVLSGGNGSSYPLAMEGQLPARINELRIGGLPIFGIEYVERRYLEKYCHSSMEINGLTSNTFLLHAEVIEVREKPTVPVGVLDVDAFMKPKVFVNNGVRRTALLALGQQDVSWENILPRDTGIRVMGQTSNHTVIDVQNAAKRIETGDIITFEVDYTALMQLCGAGGIRKKLNKIAACAAE